MFWNYFFSCEIYVFVVLCMFLLLFKRKKERIVFPLEFTFVKWYWWKWEKRSLKMELTFLELSSMHQIYTESKSESKFCNCFSEKVLSKAQEVILEFWFKIKL